jgi:hypothetical protein
MIIDVGVVLSAGLLLPPTAWQPVDLTNQWQHRYYLAI